MSDQVQLYGSGPAAANILGITGVPEDITENGQTDPFDISRIERALCSVQVSEPEGGTPTLRVYLEVQDALGLWLPVWTSVELTGASFTYGSVGPGTANVYVLTHLARYRWVVGGTDPSWPDVKLGLAGQ